MTSASIIAQALKLRPPLLTSHLLYNLCYMEQMCQVSAQNAVKKKLGNFNDDFVNNLLPSIITIDVYNTLCFHTAIFS